MLLDSSRLLVFSARRRRQGECRRYGASWGELARSQEFWFLRWSAALRAGCFRELERLATIAPAHRYPVGRDPLGRGARRALWAGKDLSSFLVGLVCLESQSRPRGSLWSSCTDNVVLNYYYTLKANSVLYYYYLEKLFSFAFFLCGVPPRSKSVLWIY